jgi:dehydrogenase/reductase SDR family protein 12
MGVYYLTQKLIPCLHEKSRTVIVSSGGMYTQPLVNDDIYMKTDFDGTVQYARNKRMQVVLA